MRYVSFLLLIVIFSCSIDNEPNLTLGDVFPIEKVKQKQEIIPDISLPEPFPIASANIEAFRNTVVDSSAIPILNLEDSWVYYPIQIGQIACCFYSRYYYTGDTLARDYFLKLAYWMKANFTVKDRFGVWLCNQAYHYHYTEDVWASCMSQGYGMIIMYHAYQLTGDKSFLKYGDLAVNAFNKSFEEGGVQSQWGKTIFYEEYPSKAPTHVLDGYLFSLISLYQYHQFTGNLNAKTFFNKGVYALKKHLKDYDIFFTSVLDFRKEGVQLASVVGSGERDKYHHIHIVQLIWLYEKTKDPLLKKYALRFLKYDLGQAPLHPGINKLMAITVRKGGTKAVIPNSLLMDGIWTEGDCYNINKGDALSIVLPEEVSEVDRIVYYAEKGGLSKEGEVMIKTNNQWKQVSSLKKEFFYPFEEGKRTADVLTLMFNEPYDNVDSLKIIFSKSCCLREVDVHYERKAMYKKIKERLK